MSDGERNIGGYVIATRRLVEERLPVLYMYHEEPEDGDSGWRFFAGDETDEYLENPENIGIYDIQTILAVDDEVLPYLDAPVGFAYERGRRGELFTRVEGEE